MYSASSTTRAVALAVLSGFFGAAAYSQTAQFMSREAGSFRLSSLSPSSRPCTPVRDSAPAGLRSDTPPTNEIPAPCDCSAESATPVLPCNLASPTAGCSPPPDAVREQLSTTGRQGHEILQAREKVLQILQSDNTCAQWYRSKDADPAATFRTLSFELGPKGDEYALENKESGALYIIRNPYVARVFQGDGSYATVTLNPHGAFFSPMATLMEAPKEGGPVSFRGVRQLHVGPYGGGTLRAQVVTLLHEFGHLLELLPPDREDYEGKSVQNTMEVLRFCRPQVESKDGRDLISTSR